MLKNIIFTVLAVALGFNFALVAQETKTARSAQAVQAVTPQTIPATTKNVDKVSLRVDNQIKRLTKDLELSEKQAADAHKLYTDYDNKQADLRKQLTELNKERQAKFEELLTDEQKQKMNEKKNNAGKLRQQSQLKLNAPTKNATTQPENTNSPQLKMAAPATEQKK